MRSSHCHIAISLRVYLEGEGRGGDGRSHDIPDAVERAHHSDKEDHESKRQRVGDEPTSDEQSDGEEDGQDGEPVPLPPPEREQEADPQHHASDLARDDVEAAECQQGADDGGSQVAGGQGDEVLAAEHVGDAAFARVERDGFNTASGTYGGECMAKLVEGDDQHLGGCQ